MSRTDAAAPPVIYVGQLGPHENSYRRMQGLIALGHEALPIDTTGKQGNLVITLAEKTIARLGYPPDLSEINSRILSAVDTGRFGVLWVDGGRKLNQSTLIRAKNTKPQLIICHYNSDNAFGRLHAHWRSFRSTISMYDFHFVPTAGNVENYTKAGAKRVLRLKRGYCSMSHRPTSLTDADRDRYDSDILFIGHWEPEREEKIASLIKAGFRVKVIGKKRQWIWGRQWRIIKSCFHQGPVKGLEYTKALCATKIALNFYSRWNVDTENSRMYEIPACGAFMLCERNEDSVQVFSEGKEAEFFSSEEELISKSGYYLNHSSEREAVALSGYTRCTTSGYDYVSRMKWMLGAITNVHDSERQL